MPSLSNCPHMPDGWCLGCVTQLARERDELRGERDGLADAIRPLCNLMSHVVAGHDPDEVIATGPLVISDGIRINDVFAACRARAAADERERVAFFEERDRAALAGDSGRAEDAAPAGA